MGDAPSSNFWNKDSSVLPAHNRDAQRLDTFVNDDVARFLQVRPDVREGSKLEGSIAEAQLNTKEEKDKDDGAPSSYFTGFGAKILQIKKISTESLCWDLKMLEPEIN